MKNYWICINTYRKNHEVGFSNTWKIYRCSGLKEQNKILKLGLKTIDSDCPSTCGIRLATVKEIIDATKDLKRFGEFAVPYIELDNIY